MKTLKISEMFYGLQGEGVRMGFPSIFVRLGGCNLTCKGFGCQVVSPKNGEIITGCDTIFSVHNDFEPTWEKYESWNVLVQNISDLVPETIAYNEELVDIIITGGEPMLHHSNHVLIGVLEHFISRGHKVFIETNGTIPVNFELYSIYKKVQFSISTKMAISGARKVDRMKPKVVNSYLFHTKGSYLKFVLDKKNLMFDSFELMDFLSEIPTYGIVYCMPLGATRVDLFENAATVYEYAAQNGFRYSDRLHIRIFDDKQGV